MKTGQILPGSITKTEIGASGVPYASGHFTNLDTSTIRVGSTIISSDASGAMTFTDLISGLQHLYDLIGGGGGSGSGQSGYSGYSGAGGSSSFTAGTACVQSPLTTSTLTTQAHGLGKIPDIAYAYYECLSTDRNFSAGDRVQVCYPTNAADAGTIIRADATNCYILTGAGTDLRVLDASSPAYTVAIDFTKWKAVVVPYLVGASPSSGYSGYSGYSGTSGYSGYSGSSGYSGYSGSGLSGYSGYSAVGLSGYSGYSGPAGAGASGVFLLDQSTPQYVTGGSPNFMNGIVFGDQTAVWGESSTYHWHIASENDDKDLRISGEYPFGKVYISELSVDVGMTAQRFTAEGSNAMVFIDRPAWGGIAPSITAAVKFGTNTAYNMSIGLHGASVALSDEYIHVMNSSETSLLVFTDTGDFIPYASGTKNIGTQASAFSSVNAQTGRFDTVVASSYAGVPPSGSHPLISVPPDHTVSGMTASFTANEAQAMGDVCYINSGGKMQLGNSSAIATSLAVGMCADPAIAINKAGYYLLQGIARDDSWNWIVGSGIYLSTTGTTGNTLTQSAPTGTNNCIVLLGVATHADRMYFNPSLQGIVEHT